MLRRVAILVQIILGNISAQEIPKSLESSVSVELFASESLIQTPTGAVVDGLGRLLVIESHTHFRPKDWKGSEHDEIVWLKDTDGDGKADARQVIFNETDATMDIAWHPDGWVYVATRNEILRWRDDNHDAVPDKVERKLLFLDTKGSYPHNGLSGLAFAADGNLYFGLGENLGEPYKLRGKDDEITDTGGSGGAVFWCTKDGARLRQVSKGFWNPFGVCVDAFGNVFATDNDPDSRPPCRLVHVVDGGDFGYAFRYGRSGLHPFIAWNGELPGTLPMLSGTGEAPCDIIQWQNRLLVASWVDHRVEAYALVPKDGSFQADRQILIEGGVDFRPVSFAPTQDGGFYLTDWVKRDYVLHGHGRVWKVKTSAPLSAANVATADEGTALRTRIVEGESPTREEVRAWLTDPRPYIRSAAIHRVSKEEFLLADMAAQSWGDSQLDAGILLAARDALKFQEKSLPPLGVQMILRSLAHPSEHVVLMGLKWISDSRLSGFKSAVQGIVDRGEMTASVYYAALTTLARLTNEEAREDALIKQLLGDVRDMAVPLARKRLALEILPDRDRHLKVADVVPVIETAAGSTQIWLIHYAGTLRDSAVGAEMRRLAFNTKLTFDARSAAMAHAVFEQGDAKELVAIALSNGMDDITRRSSMQALVGLSLPDDLKSKVESLGNLKLKPYAMRAVGKPSSVKQRPPLDAMDRWTTLLANVEGQGDVANGRQVFMSSKLGGCVVCHRVEGLGSGAGPDLSTIGLTGDLSRLLESLLQPSRSVSPRYECFNVTTTDGQVRMGFSLIERGDNHTYIDIGGNQFEIKIGDLVKREPLPVSIMPEGLVNRLTDAELRDLLAFLQAQKRQY
ncbi:MAG: c-type cytochrome [Verrucomicrobiaceae bacterium]|nr:c-type cytochrome [Verrucomicrobiaceae bacterium]